MLLLIAFGVTIKAGVAGAVVIVLTAVLLALGIGGLGLVLALRSASQEIVQSTFPVLFVLLFVSGTCLPRYLVPVTQNVSRIPLVHGELDVQTPFEKTCDPGPLMHCRISGTPATELLRLI